MKQEQAANTDDNELTLVPDPFLVVSCPFLGVRNDPGTPMGFPTPGNQCYALEPAQHVDLEKQRNHCLSDNFANCLYFQEQMAESSAEKGSASRSSNPLRRIVNGRTLAAMMMLFLILLAILIWWPPPGTSTDEGTVFGVSFGLNSPNVESENLETAESQAGLQEENGTEESIPAAIADGVAEDVQQADPIVDTIKKEDDSKRSAPFDQSAGQGATLNSLSVDDAAVTLEEADSPPVVQNSSPEPEEAVEVEPSEAPATTAVEKKPATEERVEKSEDEEGSAPEIASSYLPDQDRVEQSLAADSGDGTEKKGQFNPIVYGDQGSDGETLKVYQDPDVERGSFIEIARPELVSFLGRDNTAEWIKIRTEDGIEGWVLASETEFGSWTKSLPEIDLQ